MMNAADVLAEAADNHRIGSDSVPEFTPPLEKMQTAALLAHGEQGVAILPDGTLWALDAPWNMNGFRLVPVSAEAGDTEQPYREMIDLAMPINEVRLPDPDDSAGAGDTDGD